MDWGGGIGPAIADTIQQMGRTRAQGAAAKGQLIGRSLAEIGQFFANAPQREALQQERQARTLGLQALTEQRQQGIEDRKQDESGRQALMDVLADPKFYDPNTGEPDDGAIAMEVQKRGGVKAAQSYIASAEARGKLTTQATTARESRQKAKQHTDDLIADIIHQSPDADAAHALMGQYVRAGSIAPEDAGPWGQIIDQWGPNYSTEAAKVWALSSQGQTNAAERAKAFNTPHDLAPEHALVLPGQDGQPPQTIATGPPKAPTPEKPPTVGSFEDFVTRKYGPQATPAQILEGRKLYGQADDRPSVTVQTGAQANIPGNWDVTGEDFLKSIPPQWRATVKKIAAYDEDPTKVASMRGGMRETLMQWVNQVNPAYDQSSFALRSPTKKAFTIGTQGQQINAINTAIGHIDQLTTLSDALQNGGFTPGNKAWNTVRSLFGSEKVTNFDTLKDALAGEVSSVLAKGGATVSGIAEAKEKINAANSPQQLAGYVKTLIPVMGSKLAELNYQYHQAMGEDDPYSALSPASVTILKRLGFDPAHPEIGANGGGAAGGGGAAVSVQAPNGKTYTFKSQADADAFKAKARIQ